MIEFISHLAPSVLYPFIFIGNIFLGGLVLVPAIYLTQVGVVKLWILFFITIASGMTSDSFWYLVGHKGKEKRLYALPFIQSRIQEAEKFSAFFKKHGVILVYFTKFIYGTRIASHVLSGVHRINYFKFLIATALGTATWFGIFYFLIRSIDIGIESAKATAFRIEIIFLIVVIVILLLNWLTGTYIKKRMMKE